MTRVSRLLHLDDGEFPELRAQIEAKPIRVGIHEPLPPLLLGAPARAVAGLAELRDAEPSPVEQVRAAYDQTMRKIWAIWHMGPLNTDWSARLADDWTHIADRFDSATKALYDAKAQVAKPEAAKPSRLPNCDCGAPRFDAGMPTCTDCDEAAYAEWWNAQASQPSDAETELALYDTPEAGR